MAGTVAVTGSSSVTIPAIAPGTVCSPRENSAWAAALGTVPR